MNCPNCHEKICSITYVQDGGSILCKHCKIKFHICLGGKVKYGSPGPTICPICKTNCPNCHEKIRSGIILNDGGSILCEHCNVTFHVCLNNTIKYGSPGPTMCSFCQIEKIIFEYS